MDAGDSRSVDVVLKAADEALYLAKQLGRNRVEHCVERDVEQDVEHAPAAPAASELLDEAVISELEQLEGDVLTELVPLYFDQATELISELSGAIVGGQTLIVGRTAHKLNGSSKTVPAGA